jgi:hypothetical protein
MVANAVSSAFSLFGNGTFRNENAENPIRNHPELFASFSDKVIRILLEAINGPRICWKLDLI